MSDSSYSKYSEMDFIKTFFLIFLMLCFRTAFAQACPQGSVPVGGGNAGYFACVPMEQGDDTINTQPSGHWRKTWGALADGTNGIGGAVINAPSRQQAESDALDSCKERGGLDCKLSASYFNQCIAVASPKVGGGQNMWVSAGTVKVASKRVLNECSDVNQGRSCTVVYSACSKPILERY